MMAQQCSISTIYTIFDICVYCLLVLMGSKLPRKFAMIIVRVAIKLNLELVNVTLIRGYASVLNLINNILFQIKIGPESILIRTNT